MLFLLVFALAGSGKGSILPDKEIESQVDWLEKNCETNPALTLEKGWRLHALLAANPRPEWEARTLTALSRAYYNQGDFRDSLSFAFQALLVAQKSGQRQGLATIYYWICTAYWKMGQYEESLDNAMKANALYQELGDKSGMAATLNRIATIYIDLRKTDQALEYNERSLAIYRELHDRFNEARLLSNRSVAYLWAKDYRNMLKFALQALKINEKMNDKVWMRYPLMNSAIAYGELGNYQRAKAQFRRALDIVEPMGDKNNLCIIMKFISILERKAGKYAQAEEAGKKALAIALAIDQKVEVRDDYLELAHLYAQKGDYQQAYDYYQKYQQASKAVFDSELNTKLANVQTRFEILSRENRIALLQMDSAIRQLQLHRQRLLRNGLFLGILLLAGMFVLAIRGYRLKARMNRVLDEAARTDPLTGLANRRDIMEKVAYERIRMERSQKPFAMIIADIDDFKHFNDNYGHECGDLILQGLAKLLKETLRKQDHIARLGGEEFLMVLPETDGEGGWHAAEKIRSRVAAFSLAMGKQTLTATMSFGICPCTLALSNEECLRRADEALYRAKQMGKNASVLSSVG